jgi:hypothetical protein
MWCGCVLLNQCLVQTLVAVAVKVQLSVICWWLGLAGAESGIGDVASQKIMFGITSAFACAQCCARLWLGCA